MIMISEIHRNITEYFPARYRNALAIINLYCVSNIEVTFPIFLKVCEKREYGKITLLTDLLFDFSLFIYFCEAY